jgi:hypothetical protein
MEHIAWISSWLGFFIVAALIRWRRVVCGPFLFAILIVGQLYYSLFFFLGVLGKKEKYKEGN